MDKLGTAVDRVYAAVGAAEQWPEALRAVGELTGAGSGCIVSAQGGNARGNVGCFHDIDPAWIEAYNDRYYHYDPTTALLAAEPGRVHVDHVTGPRPADARGDARIFFNEVMRPQGFRHTLHVGLSGTDRWAAGIVLQRSARRGPFGAEAVKALERVAPHLRRALTLHARVSSVDGLNIGMAAALDRAPMGVILLDVAGRVVHTNARADEVLRSTSALRAMPDGISARHPRDHRGLQKLIAGAVAAASDPRGTTMWLHGPGGDPALQVQVTPLRPDAEGDPLVPGGVKAAVWLGNSAPPAVSAEALSALYGLTPAEGELLARLVGGLTQSEIAELRCVTLETVRSQLKAVMSKLGVSRQADLVRLVLSGPGAIASGG